MSIAAHREGHKPDLQRLILETAERLFVQAGSYDAVSMRKIASAINYSATTIYLYFKDKDALFQTLLRSTFRELSRAVTLAITDPDPVVGLYQAMNACVRFGLDHPEHYRLLFMVRPSLGAAGGAGSPIAEETLNLLRHQVGMCVSAGRLLEIDQELVTQGIWAVVHGLTSLLLRQPETRPEPVAKHVLGSYLAGLLTK